jgi:hypothetical protein
VEQGEGTERFRAITTSYYEKFASLESERERDCKKIVF